MKKVILILNEAPLPFSSAASRWYYILASKLQAHPDVELNLFAACSSEVLKKECEILFPQGKFYLYETGTGFFKKINSLIKPLSYTISKKMKRDISQEIERGVDVIHVEQVFSSWALPVIDHRALLSIHYLTTIDLKNYQATSFKDFLVIKLKKWKEKQFLKKYQNIKSCSERISKEIYHLTPHARHYVFPFAIDFSQYKFLTNENRLTTNTITLIASMGWYPGKTAAIRLLENIWPKLKRQHPEMKLKIIGWSARAELNKYINIEGVEILENVPDISKYFYQSDLLIYTPPVGSGVKIKIQEAMCYGTPIVTNREGAEGLNLIDGTHALLAEGDEEIIDAVSRLYQNRELQNILRKNAREHVESFCSPEKIVSECVKIYQVMS